MKLTPIQELYNIAKDNANHIAVLNDETGQLRDSVKLMKNDVSALKTTLVQVTTDVAWLKKTYWIIAGASIGGLIAGMLNLVL